MTTKFAVSTTKHVPASNGLGVIAVDGSFEIEVKDDEPIGRAVHEVIRRADPAAEFGLEYIGVFFVSDEWIGPELDWDLLESPNWLVDPETGTLNRFVMLRDDRVMTVRSLAATRAAGFQVPASHRLLAVDLGGNGDAGSAGPVIDLSQWLSMHAPLVGGWLAGLVSAAVPQALAQYFAPTFESRAAKTESEQRLKVAAHDFANRISPYPSDLRDAIDGKASWRIGEFAERTEQSVEFEARVFQSLGYRPTEGSWTLSSDAKAVKARRKWIAGERSDPTGL